jgi:two-component system, chemotaxis family, CheB/CheR fusion protein
MTSKPTPAPGGKDPISPGQHQKGSDDKPAPKLDLKKAVPAPTEVSQLEVPPIAPAPQTPSPAKPFPIVGVGASAGGLEAFTSFLSALPTDTGMAFVLVQHMDPTHESMLDKLLARDTTMSVIPVTDGMSVEPNVVYVIPPNTEMTISHGILRLAGRPAAVAWHPIDTFLCSLAEDQSIRAIGIVLSGIGSDGTKGLQAIKAGGGITFAQDEDSSKYPGMPLAAFAAGCVDLVLSPDRIATELARMILHPYLHLAPQQVENELPSETDGNLGKILLLVRRATGVDFADYKRSTIRRRIARRMALRRCETTTQYARYVELHSDEAQALFEDLLIQVTSFFRDPEAFNFLKAKVFPQISASLDPDESIRIWVPGCASGEEVYSIAIALNEFVDEMHTQRPIQIFGTDVSEAAIRKARAGVYSESATAGVSPEQLRRFFVRVENGAYRISKSIRDSCVFARHDVTKDPPFSRMDLVSCRNLLIYLGLGLQKKVLNYLYYALKPSGFLLLGKNETVSAKTDLFTLDNREANVYTKLPSAAVVASGFQLPETQIVTAGDVDKQVQMPRSHTFDLRKEAEHIVLQRYSPPAVVVNSNLEVVYLQGDTSPFLRLSPGKPNLDFLKLLGPELMIQMRPAIQQAKKSRRPTRHRNIEFKRDGHRHLIDVEVVPIATQAPEPVGFVVLFRDLRAAAPVKQRSPAAPKVKTRKDIEEIERLRRDLACAKENLQTVVEDQEVTGEELRAANEELLSNNEELQSTNEELQTTKEELQSGNEELGTINAELQRRNFEMNRSANDLNSLLRAIEIPVVIVGQDGCLRHFTPAASKLLNLLPSDVGHPLSRIRPTLDFPNLGEPAAEVVETGHVVEKEVRDNAGRWYILRAQPYNTPENDPEGVLIEILDINDLKQLSIAIVETMAEPLLVLDSQLRVLSANRAFYEKFCVKKEETENHLLFDLGNRQWNIPRLRELLEKVLPDKQVIENFRVEHDFPGIGHKVMLLNARQLRQEKIGAQKVLLFIDDITERQR